MLLSLTAACSAPTGGWGLSCCKVVQQGIAAALHAWQLHSVLDLKPAQSALSVPCSSAACLSLHTCSAMPCLAMPYCTISAEGPGVTRGMGAGGNRYTGPMHCMRDIIKQEGMRGLFKGWTANYARLGPQTTVIFVVMEQIRSMSGLGAL